MKRTLSRLELLGLAGAANTTREAAEGDDLLVVRDVAKVGVRLRELEACIPLSQPFPSSVLRANISTYTNTLTGQGSRNLAHVLEVRPEVLAPGARSCRYSTSTVSLPSHNSSMHWACLNALFSGLVARAAAA